MAGQTGVGVPQLPGLPTGTHPTTTPRKAPSSPLTLNAVATDKAAHCFTVAEFREMLGFECVE